MATTYKKALKTIVVKTIGGTTVTVADTVAEANASNALAEFEAYKTMHIKLAANVTEIPFHAVDNIVVTVAESEEQSKADAYGCE